MLIMATTKHNKKVTKPNISKHIKEGQQKGTNFRRIQVISYGIEGRMATEVFALEKDMNSMLIGKA